MTVIHNSTGNTLSFILFITACSSNVHLNYYTTLKLENNCKNTMQYWKFCPGKVENDVINKYASNSKT